jgi:hypothetical protein
MTSHSNGTEPATSAFAGRGPLRWITAVADQVAEEAGLARTADIEDLVIIAYVGLLDSPDPQALCPTRLLERCRQDLIVWAWELGAQEETIPIMARRRG